MCGQKYCFGCGSCVESDGGLTQVPQIANRILQSGHKTVSKLHCVVVIGEHKSDLEGYCWL